MKRLFAIVFSVLLWSCSVDDDHVTYTGYHEILPIASVTMPEEFQLGQSHEITLNYINPTTCHVFNDIYYVKNDYVRTVAIISFVYQDNAIECTPQEVEKDVTFNFKPIASGLYTFKFWQGENDAGEDDYLIIEVPVID
ncbi:MAG: hypothetical protein GYB39_07630 [Algicola sp.]|nr:hypothetical protein [Algicola sp.]